MAVKFDDVKYKDIFKSLNFEINEGQITSIVGKNDIYNTSLLNLIYGLDLNFSGKIILDNNLLNNKIKKRELLKIRKNMIYIPEIYEDQLFNINIFEDIKYNVHNLNIDKLNELLKNFNLKDEILKKNYFELSLGEFKKVMLIIMLLKDSKIMLLDNPNSHLDQKGVEALIKLLKKEKRKDKVIIIYSRDSQFLLSVSDQIMIIENSKIRIEENKYEFFSNHKLMKRYNLDMPSVLQFRECVLNKKNIKLVYRDNINDLIKDIYRNVK
jgi:energy-coupling factor transport system ATP-binding protein